MNDRIYITSYCSIDRNIINIDGNIECVKDYTDFQAFIKSLYQGLGIQYPKFYKMDNLSRLAFVSSELLKGKDMLNERYPGDEIGVVLLTTSSSLDTDCRHFNSIKDDESFFPSPAAFVYTLPNIMAGEICIRNRFHGENTVFIDDDLSDESVMNYVADLFRNGIARACIFGRVSLFLEDFSSFMMLVETDVTNKILEFNPDNVKKISSV